MATFNLDDEELAGKKKSSPEDSSKTCHGRKNRKGPSPRLMSFRNQPASNANQHKNTKSTISYRSASLCALSFTDSSFFDQDYENEATAAAVHRFADYPLVVSMLEFESVRNDALDQEGQLQKLYPKGNSGWIRTIFMCQGRAFDRVILPYVIVLLNSVTYTVLQELVFEEESNYQLASWEAVITVVLNTTLGFLLVFRLNRAATRTWLGRELWGNLVARARTLVSGILTYGRHCPANRDHAIRWIAAFCLCTRDSIRGNHNKLSRAVYAGILTENLPQQT